MCIQTRHLRIPHKRAMAYMSVGTRRLMDAVWYLLYVLSLLFEYRAWTSSMSDKSAADAAEQQERVLRMHIIMSVANTTAPRPSREQLARIHSRVCMPMRARGIDPDETSRAACSVVSTNGVSHAWQLWQHSQACPVQAVLWAFPSLNQSSYCAYLLEQTSGCEITHRASILTYLQ